MNLRHSIQLGKMIGTGKAEDELFVKKPSREVFWQLDRIIAIVIRDYLRIFIHQTPAIGNCVIVDNPEGWDYFEACKHDELFAKRWEDKVNQVADEFDELRLLIEQYENRDGDIHDEDIQKQIEISFSDLTEIYMDLCW